MLHVVYFNGTWDESNNYTDFEVTGVLVPTSCSFDDLNGLVCRALKWDCNSISMSIKFQIKKYVPLITLSDEYNFRFFLEVIRKSDEQFKFPLLIDKLYNNKSATVNQGLRTKYNGMQIVSNNNSSQWDSDLTPLETQSYQIGARYYEQMAIEIIDREQERQQHISFLEEYMDQIISDPNKFAVKVQQTYKDKKVLAQAMRQHSIALNRQHKVVRPSSRDYVIVCIDNKNCIWNLRASKYRATNFFKVRAFVDIHTCSANILLGDHRQATSEMISECIMHKITNLKRTYIRTDIVDDIRTEYNVSISYKKAWRSKENALIKLRENPHDYSLIPAWLYMLEQTNPGTITSLELETNGNFKYIFFAIGASIEAWSHCFPITVIDGTFIQSTYKGTLLIASTQDAYMNIVPLAFAVVDSENEQSWR